MKLGSDPDVALTEVLSKVQGVRGQLPSDAEDPVIVKGTGQQFALMYLALQNPNMTPEQLTEYIERVIRPRMSTITGVAEIQVMGAAEYSMRVWIDPIKLASRGLTAAEVLGAIRSANFLSAPGKTRNEYVAYSITVESTLQTPEAFGAIPLMTDNLGGVVRLRDVAQVELAAKSNDTIVDFNGARGTFIGVFPSPSANPLTTASAVIADLPAIQASLPDGMAITLVYDSTETIASSIEEVFKTIGEAVAIVVIVILLFLGSFRSVLMPVITIPLSLVGVCFLLYAMGYSINLLSLLAMVLAIGLVVDDAIVVVENIHRHIEEGAPPMAAAFTGMKEITGPVVAMTITLAAVFTPLAFTGGLTGSLFREFSMTLAGAVIISGFVALTITPAMSARILQQGNHSRFQKFVDRLFERIADGYEKLVSGSLKYRPITLLVVVALAGVTGYMFTKTSSELAPEEDQGALFAIVNSPRYATSAYTKAYVDQMRDLTKDLEELKVNFSIVSGGGSSAGFSIWVFKDWSERTRSQKQLQTDIQARINKVAGVQAFVFAPPSLPGAGGGLPISMVVQSTGDSSQVYEIAERIRQQAQASGKYIVVQSSLAFDAPQVTMSIDRGRAAALNLPISDIGTTLALLVGGASVAQFDRDSNSYDIILQVPEEYRSNPQEAGRLFHPLGERQDGAFVSSHVDKHQRGPSFDRTVQPAEFIDHLSPTAAWSYDRRRIGGAGKHRASAAPSRLLYRLFRSVASREGAGLNHPDRIRSCAGGYLPRACCAIRELPRSTRHLDGGAVVHFRRSAAAQSRSGHAQHLYSGRPDYAYRPDHETWHPLGRIRQSAA
jgi:multidrug efflux pump